MNGIAISAVHPSLTMTPPVSNRAFHESSPKMPKAPDELMLLMPPPPLREPVPLDEPEDIDMLRLELLILPVAFTIESPCTP